MMIVLVLFAFFNIEAYAVPELCKGSTCGPWKNFGLKYDWNCGVTNDNLVTVLPSWMVSSPQQCEAYAKDSIASIWYNYRASGSCELLSHCEYPVKEQGSVTGPDPGEGETCFIEATTAEPATTVSSAITTTKPQTTTTLPPSEALLAIGGQTFTGVISSIDVITEDLEVISGALPDAPRADVSMTAVLIDDQVVVCGGWENRDDCLHLNLTSRTWQENSKLVEARAQLSPVVYNQTVYVFGGVHATSNYLSTVEKYHSATNSWTNVPEWTMPEPLHQFCAVEHDHYIYIIGGRGIPDNRVMRRLSTVTNVYETMPSMQWGRNGHQCVVTSIEGEKGILVTGGTDISYTEFFSFALNKWRYLADMNTARAFHGIGVLKGQPIVFGGYTPFLDSLEVYSSIEDKWTIVDGSKLTQPKYFFAHVKVPWGEI